MCKWSLDGATVIVPWWSLDGGTVSMQQWSLCTSLDGTIMNEWILLNRVRRNRVCSTIQKIKSVDRIIKISIAYVHSSYCQCHNHLISRVDYQSIHCGHVVCVQIVQTLYYIDAVVITRWRYCLGAVMITRWQYCLSAAWIVNVFNCKKLWIARRNHQHLQTAGKDH